MYNKIINPITRRKVNINGKLAQTTDKLPCELQTRQPYENAKWTRTDSSSRSDPILKKPRLWRT